jgi:DNA (cytosine-5)-methyltransferase 1
MNVLKVIELFAGVGAQRQGLKEANIDHEVVAISEIDKYAIKVYEKLHGNTPNLGDITKIERSPIVKLNATL